MTTPPPSDWTPEPDVAQQRPLADGATTNTWSIWVMALLPLLGVATTIAQDPGAQIQRILARTAQQVQDAQSGVVTVPMTPFQGFSLLSLGLSLLITAIQVALAVLDQRALRRIGVIRPFPWGWVFLNPTYIIGRHVVVRRRVRGSLAPLWTWIVVEVVALVVVVVIITTAISTALSTAGLR